MQASGFPCEGCGQDRLATITHWGDVGHLTLHCHRCEHVWTVSPREESA